MLRNTSYNNKDIKDDINRRVGYAYSILQRVKLGGTGSPRFVIMDASSDIDEFLERDNNINYCHIELRPGGIIVSFRSILETFSWIIPYHMLVIYKSKGTITLYSGEQFMRIQSLYKNKGNNSFFRKLIHLRSEYHTEQYEFKT